VAHCLEVLQAGAITHVLNVGSGIDNQFPDDVIYRTIELLDLPETNLCDSFEEANAFIDVARAAGGRIFVHW